MAYGANELFSSTVRSPFPRIVPRHAYQKTIGPIAGAPTLEVCYPMAFDENEEKWVPWSASGSANVDVIKGFIYPKDVDTHATNDVLGIIMVEGEVHYDDIILPSGESQADLDAALRSGPLARGLVITGLTKSR